MPNEALEQTIWHSKKGIALGHRKVGIESDGLVESLYASSYLPWAPRAMPLLYWAEAIFGIELDDFVVSLYCLIVLALGAESNAFVVLGRGHLWNRT